MPKPDGYLVQGTKVTPVEIQDASAFNVSMAVRELGTDDPFRRVMAVQVHDTAKRAAVDIQRYLARQDHEKRRRRRIDARWRRVTAESRRFALGLFSELVKR